VHILGGIIERNTPRVHDQSVSIQSREQVLESVTFPYKGMHIKQQFFKINRCRRMSHSADKSVPIVEGEGNDICVRITLPSKPGKTSPSV